MKQELESGEVLYKSSRFHIVDLAGSERTKDTGAEGIRLKEAGAINKSLAVLGQVIYDLSDSDTSKHHKKHIRYRESKLTHLLRDSLGGNSLTVMICNINPHCDALRETRSTLQFAQRAKNIKNKAVVNEESSSAEYWKAKYNELLN
jgi:kinesin family protein 15